MLPQALQLLPYIAIASAILLGVTIGIICYGQFSRRAHFGVPRRSISSIFEKWRGAVFGRPPARRAVTIHDPDASKPHDLDDAFFDENVRERVGAIIAESARKT